MSRKMNGSAAGKGYYIALILCAVAIGISGYLYYKNANSEPDRQANEPAAVTGGKDVPAVATKPTTTQTPATAAAEKPLKTASPLEGETAAAFAMDALAYNPTTRDWRTHNGVDYACTQGAAVAAPVAGKVVSAGAEGNWGTVVVLEDAAGRSWRLCGVANPAVKAGDTVAAGQKLGTVGTVGCECAEESHIHVEVKQGESYLDPAKLPE